MFLNRPKKIRRYPLLNFWFSENITFLVYSIGNLPFFIGKTTERVVRILNKS